MTTHYDIVKKWIDSCETEQQLDTVWLFINNKLITDEKQKDDMMEYLHKVLYERAWLASKVANRDMVRVERFPACDEQPSDNCTH